MKIKAYFVKDRNGKLEPFFKKRFLQKNDVL